MKINCPVEELSMRPDAVLVDLDHTLYDYDRPHAKALAAVREKLHRTAGVAPDHFDELYDNARKHTKEYLGVQASAHSRLLYFQRVIELAGLRSNVVMSLDCEQTYWRSFLSNAELLPGAEDTMRLIRSLGMPMAIVTDLTAQIQFRKIVYFGLETIFEHVVTSEEAGADKPSPRIFQFALDKVGVGPNSRIWMISDEPTKDCAGAKNCLGATTFLRRAGREVSKYPSIDVVFDRFDELKSVFEKFQEK